MAILESTIAPSGAAFQANRDGMLALIARMRSLEDRARAASAAARDRFHKRGQLLPRERVALVLDPGSPFIELSTLAGYMFDVPDADKSVPGGGVIAGIGFVSGIRCMVSANDSGIDAGALQPMGLDKQLRVQELALENRLPFVQLVYAYQGRGEADKARRALEAAVRLSPNPEMRDALTQMLLTQPDGDATLQE